MKRRQFIQGSAVGAIALSAPAIVGAAPKEWKLVTSLPKNLPGPGVSAVRFADRVAKMSGGRLKIKVYGRHSAPRKQSKMALLKFTMGLDRGLPDAISRIVSFPWRHSDSTQSSSMPGFIMVVGKNYGMN